MSQMHDAQAELKKQFLGQLIIADFECSRELCDSKPGERLIDLLSIYRVASHIVDLVPDGDKKEIEKLLAQIESWIENKTPLTIIQVIKSRQPLTRILAKNFYAELNIGIIPTGTLQVESAKPKNLAMDQHQTSRI